jgi:hypothetical protein
LNELIEKSQDEITSIMEGLSVINLRQLSIELWKQEEIIGNDFKGNDFQSIRANVVNQMDTDSITISLKKQWLM